MVLSKGLGSSDYTGAIILYVIFAFWAIFTLAILVMMEGLSAFLHTLRLHWLVYVCNLLFSLKNLILSCNRNS